MEDQRGEGDDNKDGNKVGNGKRVGNVFCFLVFGLGKFYTQTVV